MKGFYLRYIGRPPARRAAQRGGHRVVYNLARSEQMVRLKLLLSEPEATNRRLNSEDQNQKRPKTKQPRRIKRHEKTNGRSRLETIHTEN